MRAVDVTTALCFDKTNNPASTPCAPLRCALRARQTASRRKKLLRQRVPCRSSVKPAVRELDQRLSAEGVDVWFDQKSLLPGQDWQYEIPKVVGQSDVVIVCLSKGSLNNAGYIQKEIKFALDIADEQPEGTILIISLQRKDCTVPDRLSGWQWVNYTNCN